MKCILRFIFVLFLITNISNCAPSFDKQNEEVISFLQSFGYLPASKAGSKISRKQLQHALKRMQNYGHIRVTGEIDASTLALIRTPRCGVPDVLRHHKRRKRYNLLSTKWEKHHITCSFDHKYGRFYYESQKFRRLIAEALNVWSQNSVLTFYEVSDPESADIVVSFEAPYHPHVDPFEMSPGILAHAFNPGSGIGGDVHGNEDIEWDFDVIFGEQPAGNAMSLFDVLLHELGHTMGLHHSQNPDAVMYSSYTKSTGVLSADDIEGIQHIYGVPRKPDRYPETTRSPQIDNDNEAEEIPDKCETSYDAIALIRNELFIFKGIYMWRPESDSDAIEIRKFWSLPGSLTHVDAVYEKADGTICFFSGRDIFAFSGTKFIYQSSLSHLGIGHHFKKIDAIFTWQYNKRTYIFSGDQYWRLNEDVVDRRYPKDILRSFRDVYDIDTAFSDENGLYFFKGLSYYELNHRTMRIDRMNAQQSSEKFMRCPLQRRQFKLSSRLGEGSDDVIDSVNANILPDDEDNIEKLDEITKTDAKENTSDDASSHYLLFPIFLASLAISRVLRSILLQL